MLPQTENVTFVFSLNETFHRLKLDQTFNQMSGRPQTPASISDSYTESSGRYREMTLDTCGDRKLQNSHWNSHCGRTVSSKIRSKPSACKSKEMKHLEKEISKREAHVTAESYSSLLRYFFFFFYGHLVWTHTENSSCHEAASLDMQSFTSLASLCYYSGVRGNEALTCNVRWRLGRWSVWPRNKDSSSPDE